MVDNLSEHLKGNVYARFYDEAAASKAYESLKGKYYHSNLVAEEYSPIENIKDGKCYRYEDGLCDKGGYCNFLHFKEISKSLIKSLKDEMYEIHPEYKKNRYNENKYNKKRERKHEHTSSESSLDRFDKFTRKRIIHKWNDDYLSNKKTDEKRKKVDKLERRHRHRGHHKHRKRHKSYGYDKEEKHEKMKKKEYEEDLEKYRMEEDLEKNRFEENLEKKSFEEDMGKNGIENYEKYDMKDKSKSKGKSKSKSKELINIDSDEEETISAGALK